MTKKISNFKTLQVNGDPKNYTEIFTFNGKKFRMHFEHTEGTPSGFNSKCCLDIMDQDGTFQHIMDNIEVGVSWTNKYTSDLADCDRENSKVIPAFLEYVEIFFNE